MEVDKELLKGYIDTILLSLLYKEPLYGYQFVAEVRKLTDGAFDIKEATLYLALKRLEKNGLATSYWGDSESGGGRRKYYKITDHGCSRLRQKHEEWDFLRNIMDKFLGGIRI